MADSEQATEIFVNAWAAYQKLLKVIRIRVRTIRGVGDRRSWSDHGCAQACNVYNAVVLDAE